MPLFTHIRYSAPEPAGSSSLDAIDEVLKVARETGVSLHVDHIPSMATHVMPEAIAKIEAARAEGLDVTGCFYPYTFWGTYLASARFNGDWQSRFRISYEDLQLAGTSERLTASSFKKYQTQNKLVVAYAIPQEDVDAAVKAPWTMIGSDAIPESSNNNHPRGAGCFSRLLGPYARDMGTISLDGRVGEVHDPAGPAGRAPGADDGQEGSPPDGGRRRHHGVRPGHHRRHVHGGEAGADVGRHRHRARHGQGRQGPGRREEGRPQRPSHHRRTRLTPGASSLAPERRTVPSRRPAVACPDVTDDTDLARLDACGQADLVRRGEASPVELVDAAIARIEAVNPAVNAVIHERFERARAEAAGPLPDGPFRGVPFLLKDLAAHQAGEPHHGGLLVLQREGWIAPGDDHVTCRVRAAGLVVLGRTNTPELGTTISTEPESHGPTCNPWDLTRSAGGSSGGSGAAVAALMVPAAHASDGGGSIRIPASENGLVGLKPTRARVSQGPDIGDSWAGATVHGAVTRTVRDAAAVLDALAGGEPGDPYPAPPLPGPLADEVGRPPGRLRIGLLGRPLLPGIEPDPDCAAAVAAAGALLQGLGHEVTEGHPEAMEEERFTDTFTTVVAASVALDLDGWAAEIGRELTVDDMEERNWLFAQLGRAITAPQYLAAVRWQQAWARRMAGWWAGAADRSGFDLLVCPVLNGPPPPLGWLTDPVEGLGRLTGLMQYTAQFNVTGQPAASLPLHWNAEGLPIGVQLVAGFGREDLLIRIAAQLEVAAPWADRVPPTHA